MSIILLMWVSIFTLKLKDATIFLMGIIMSGIMVLYPDTFVDSLWASLVTSLIYLLLSLSVPYILTTHKNQVSHHSFLLASLPISTLVVSTAVYQFWQERFTWITMGLLFIIEAIIYLMYAFVAGKWLIAQANNPLGASTLENKSTILVLFAIPLSLFTFSLAFIFKDVPSMMSLAWVIESAILYLVATRMQDNRIFLAWHLVLIIWLISESTLIATILPWSWLDFGILAVMCISIFSSLYILKGEKMERRVPYDILHIIAIIIISLGVSRIIPSTGTWWSIFGPAFFLVILSIVYGQIGKGIHHAFLNIFLAGLCLGFIARFDWLNKMEIFPIIVQFSALFLIYLVGYIEYQTKKISWIVSLSISLFATLLISSMYVDEFFGTFAVSIYLAIIATTLIIRGITRDNPRLRTLGLYIGIFVLLKILGYDIWANWWDLIVRVIALMVTGWLMIYLSQLYGRFVSRGWSEELSFSNITTGFSREEETKHEEVVMSEDSEEVIEIDPFVWELQNEVHHVSVSEYSGVIFISNTLEKFTIKRVSIIRLARYICTRLSKTTFAPDELNSAYAYVLGNLASTLPKAQLDLLLTQLKWWIATGWSVEFIMKNK